MTRELLAWSLLAILPLIGVSVAGGQPPALRPVKGFGTTLDGGRLAGFGKNASEMRPPNAQDRSNADSVIRRADSDKDQAISRRETKNSSRYRKYEAAYFRFDFDRDQRLTADELAFYFASLREEPSKQQKQQAQQQVLQDLDILITQQQFQAANQLRSPQRIYLPDGGKLFLSSPNSYQGGTVATIDSAIVNNNSQADWATFNGMIVFTPTVVNEQMVGTAAQHLIARNDRNGDGQLNPDEWRRIPGDVAAADSNNDRLLTVDEIVQWILSARSDQTGAAEKTLGKTQGPVAAAAEIRGSRRARPREFRGAAAVVIPSRQVIHSDLRIAEDCPIGHLAVRISIIHAAPTQMDAFLTSPDGRTVALFSGEGKKWEGEHISNAVFDDRAETSIAEAMPPFQGIWRPDGENSQENGGLSRYSGGRSRGVWRLTVRADRSQVIGLLEDWSLIIEPLE